MKIQVPGQSAFVPVGLPSGVSVVNPFVRPDSTLFQGLNRMPLVGQFNKNLIWLPNYNQLWQMGIAAGLSAPGLAAGGGTGITGTAIGVYTFAQFDSNGLLIHESNPSPASNALVMSNQNRAWSSLPTTHANARVTHIKLYISMDGSDYLLVVTLPLGTATYTEGVATNALGASAKFTRGVAPYAKFVTEYQRRMWYSDGSDTFYFSELDEPESVPAVNSLKTPDGRNINCLRGLTDTLVIMSRRSLIDLQGYSSLDFRLRIISQDLGCISHFGSVVINDKLYFPTQDGYYRFSSAGLEPLMGRTLRTYFRQQYEADPTTYEDLVASVSKRFNVLRVLVPGATAFYYIAHYIPSEPALGGTGEPPFWTFDKRARKDYVISSLTNNSLFDTQYTGSCDGYIRQEDVAADPDDDGDAYKKAVTIASRHFFMGDQGGSDDHAHTFQGLDVFVSSEQVPWTASLYAGDDDAYSAANPKWSQLVPVSALSKGSATAVKKTSHNFKPTQCAGKGVTLKLQASSPVGFEFRGMSILFDNKGSNTRDVSQ